MRSFKKKRYIGVSLGGGKSLRTHIAVLDHYPHEDKLFLSHLVRDICEEGLQTSDTVLIDIMKELGEDCRWVGINAPLSPPKCLRCRLVCPGAEDCGEEEIQWLWDLHRKRAKGRKPHKIFTPYTERCVEHHVSYQLQDLVTCEQALGSNKAPLWARADFLKKRLKQFKLVEVYPRLSLWRLGRAMKMPKSHLNHYKNAVNGEASRGVILEKWLASNSLFVYNQDAKQMIKDAFVFEAVITAFTAYLNDLKLCEPRPEGFPRSAKEGWIAFPQKSFHESL